MSYNSLDEGWIPVLRTDRTVEYVGIRDALVNAHLYTGIAESSPTVLVAIYRLLLAVLSRAAGDGDRAAWYATKLPQEAIDRYCAKWRDSFWLFHPDRPFMQVPLLAPEIEERVVDTNGEDRSKPAAALALNSVSGNNVTLWGHAYDDAPVGLDPGTALRLLLGHLGFQPMGLVRAFATAAADSVLCNKAAVLPLGRTLAQTLSLSLHPASRDDLPSWEQEAPGREQLGKKRQAFTGPNDRYTRLGRAILLIPTETLTVHRLYYGVGVSPLYEENNLEPMAAYRVKVSKGNKYRRPVAFEEGRAAWRDLPCLLPDPDGMSNEPPRILEWARALLDQVGAYDEHLEVLVAGVSANKSAILRWRLETTDIAAEFERNPEAAKRLRDLTASIETAEFKFFKVAEQAIAASMEHKPSKHTLARARAMLSSSSARERFYQSIETAFHRIRAALAAARPGEEIDGLLREALLRSSNDSLKQLEVLLGTSPHALRAMALKGRDFGALLSKYRA
jgi:CRISPR system Cascade subunit CasA